MLVALVVSLLAYLFGFKALKGDNSEPPVGTLLEETSGKKSKQQSTPKAKKEKKTDKPANQSTAAPSTASNKSAIDICIYNP